MTATNPNPTKWSILVARQAEFVRQADEIQRQLDGMENTLCGIRCSGCGLLLVTEADFAQHFTIPDDRYLNLGNCPGRTRGQPDEEDVAVAQFATWDDPTETSAWDRS